jgi:hypothetical protein
MVNVPTLILEELMVLIDLGFNPFQVMFIPIQLDFIPVQSEFIPSHSRFISVTVQ